MATTTVRALRHPVFVISVTTALTLALSGAAAGMRVPNVQRGLPVFAGRVVRSLSALSEAAKDRAQPIIAALRNPDRVLSRESRTSVEPGLAVAAISLEPPGAGMPRFRGTDLQYVAFSSGMRIFGVPRSISADIAAERGALYLTPTPSASKRLDACISANGDKPVRVKLVLGNEVVSWGVIARVSRNAGGAPSISPAVVYAGPGAWDLYSRLSANQR